MKKRKRVSLIVSLAITVIVLTGLGIGGKKMLDNQAQAKELSQEKQIAVQAKQMFKDIKEIEIYKGFEASPGSRDFGVDIEQDKGNKFHVTLSLGDDSNFYTNDGIDVLNQKGKTEKAIKVMFSNKNKEVL